MELRQLRHFLALMESRSFTRAAEECNLTPQALSKSIRRLEESLGVRLFDRDTRMVQPTLFGEQIHVFAQNIDAESHSLVRAIDTLLGHGVRSLAIGAGSVAAPRIVGEAVLATCADHPGIDITVIEGTIESLLPPLVHGKLDIAVCLLTSQVTDPMIAYEELCTVPYRVFARAGHPLAAAKNVRLADLLDFPWITGADPDRVRERVAASFEAEGLHPPKPAFHTDSLAFAVSLVVRSDTLLALPLETVRRELDAGLLTILDVESRTWASPTVALFRRNSTRSPDALRFLEHLRRITRQAPARQPAGSVARRRGAG